MYIQVNGESTFIATGGKPFAAELPTVVMLHGSSLDHRCWALQARWFAFHGYSVCLLYTSPSPRDGLLSRMPSSA